ncbi:MAG: HigA family addiction module antitoxin [Treponema sp.]|nr:HigA family addiction module antitoxin [Treponema sp.]
MPKSQTPGAVLQSYIDEYQINPFSLSKSIKVAYQSVTNILKGKARITVHMALRLSQYFGNSPKYWLDIQSASEIDELSSDKKFTSIIKSIPKASKGAKPGKNKTTTLAEKRKKAAKVPGAKGARGSKAKGKTAKTKRSKAKRAGRAAKK